MANSLERFTRNTPLPYIEALGDITRDFKSTSDMIVQINNCVSRRLHKHSFSWNLARVLPNANPYSRRRSGPYHNLAAPEHRARPGTINIANSPLNKPGPCVAFCFAQYRMGNCSSTYYLYAPRSDKEYRHMSLYKDTYAHRLDYFDQCLTELSKKLIYMPHIKNIVLPKFIGCGMGGGEWCDYEEVISRFCISLYHVRPNINVFVIEKE